MAQGVLRIPAGLASAPPLRYGAAMLPEAPYRPATLARLVTPARLALAREGLRFGVVGTLGFVWDGGMVYALRRPLGLYAAGLVAWLVAVTVNWVLNRAWTFRGGGARVHPLRQWARFVLANLPGMVLNRGAYILLVALVPLCRSWPLLAVAAGSIAGLASNFTLSRRLVFR